MVLSRRDFLALIAVAIVGGEVGLEQWRARQERDRRNAILKKALTGEGRDILGQELTLPVRDLIHFNRWARPFYGLPPRHRPPAPWELYAERLAEHRS